jgi:5-methylcytosine-specific restriction enzyme subunit McrC
VIGLPGLNLTVHPKVPLDHFLYLLLASEGFPRFDKDAALAHPEASFWELVASWFVDAAERLLRLGLVKDYRESADVLPIARGRIRPIATARLYYAGRIAVDCEFDEFDLDNALNRLIKAAAVAVAGSPLLERGLRRRAARVVWMLHDVSDAHIPDLRVLPNLRAAHYREPVDFAKRVLLGQGVAPKESETAARTFLVRTPDLIEGGIRNILVNGLAEHWGLLVFAGVPATGDVKYKLPKKWDRGDLYQAVVFATGFKAKRACIVHFEPGSAGQGSSLPVLKVGDLVVMPFA